MNRNIVITCKILQKEVGLNDADYRDLLFRTAGVRSSKDLEGRAASRVIEALEALKPEPEPVQPKHNYLIQSTLKPRKWYYDYNPGDKWDNFGTLIGKYAEQGITIVAVWDHTGKQYFKWRYTNA